MRLIFISGVSGAGKSTICNYIKDNNLLDDYVVFDVDDLENINEYNPDTYYFFYENSIKNAILKSDNKNIIIGSCINPTDIKKINVPIEIDSVDMILITSSSSEIEKRLKSRDKSRNCSDEKFIKSQIDYQNYMLNYLDLYQMHIDNSNCTIKDVVDQIIDYL